MCCRSSHREVSLGKGFVKICSKFTGEHSCRSAISIKLLCNFIGIALRHGCSPVNLLDIFRTPFPKNISEWLLLVFIISLGFPNLAFKIVFAFSYPSVFKRRPSISALTFKMTNCFKYENLLTLVI